MIVLGVDPGTKKLGYGVVRKTRSGLEFIDAGVIVARGSDRVKRVGAIGLELVTLIREVVPDAIAFEEGFLALDRGALPLSEARGALYLAAAIAASGATVTGYAPATIKATVSNGRATKDQVCRAVRAILRMQREPEEDAGDGLAIAICHANHVKAPPIRLAAAG